MDGLYLKPTFCSLPPSSAPDVRVQTTGASFEVCAKSRIPNSPLAPKAVTLDKPQSIQSSSFFSSPFKSLLSTVRKQDISPATVDLGDAEEETAAQFLEYAIEEQEERNLERLNGRADRNKRKGNWVLKILHLRSLWRDEKDGQLGSVSTDEEDAYGGNCELGGCCSVEGGDFCWPETGFKDSYDQDSFSRFLRRVSLTEAKFYGRMSYLGNLSYDIQNIKHDHLLKYLGLRFITSSLEKKAQCPAEKELVAPSNSYSLKANRRIERKHRKGISPASAYQIAASAASFLLTHGQNILPFTSSRTGRRENSEQEKLRDQPSGASNGDEESLDAAFDLARCSMGLDSCETDLSSSGVASLVATTESVTAVVAAKDETRQAVAKNLSSIHFSPCEWFVVDDEKNKIRHFVIQGSESLASWQANLLFEPIQFEGMDVLVHRGIYEAAKGLYQQMLPEVQEYRRLHGDSAAFRFTGHSLGGSLGLLVNLMLLIREEVPASSLLPVVTFGSPCIMCGGDYLLRKLGLPHKHVQAITMHRDIVPRAFSCCYPDHVAKLLKAVNVNFRNHPCLKNQKLLYAPMGEMLILQPEESLSPHHHLLPSGIGLYVLDACGGTTGSNPLAGSQLWAAKNAFLNSPHPLETLSDPGAYGSEGTISRDHDASSYLRSVRGIIRQELRIIRKEKWEQRRKAWWRLLLTEGLVEGAGTERVPSSLQQGSGGSISLSQRQESSSMSAEMFGFARIIVQGSRDSLVRFGSKLIASRNVNMLVILMLPVRMLVTGNFGVSM